MTAYQYEPLSPGSIRLLVLQPSASPDADLRGSLLCTTLSECNYDLIDNYTALSYVWGSDERPCLIFLDGKEFAITQSLNDALRNMRDVTRARRIWTDALCINQDDGPERNEQVRLMGKIYGLASSTIIYLGKLTEDAAEVLAATTLRATEADHMYETDDEDTRDAPAAEVHTKHVLIEAASRDILSRLWFQRVWVLQELVLSKSPWIQCGRQRVRWEEFCCLLLRKPTNLPDEYRILLRVLEDMHETRNARAGGVGKPLYDVLKTRRGFGAADPRDRVYANLGIINDLRQVRKYLNVDYGESVQTVFTKVAAYIICTKGATYLMTQIQDMHSKEYLQGLPSWVPQWQYPVSEIIVTRNPESSDELCGTYQVLDIDDIPSILVHTGLQVDMVRAVSAVFPGNRDAARALIATEDYRHVREELLQLYDGYLKPMKGEVWRMNAWTVIRMSGRLFLRDRESQHRRLCEDIGLAWIRFIETLDQQSNAKSSVNTDFSALFSRWLRHQARKQRAFLDVHCRFDGSERSICYGILYLLERYLESDIDNGLSGRRLAITYSGNCALVPGHAQEGDVIAALTDPTYQTNRTLPLLVLRQKEVGGSQAINGTIMEALHNLNFHKPQPDETLKPLADPEAWSAFMEEDSDCVEHCWVIGQGYVDKPLHPNEPFKEEDMRVFALH